VILSPGHDSDVVTDTGNEKAQQAETCWANCVVSYCSDGVSLSARPVVQRHPYGCIRGTDDSIGILLC